MPNESQKPRRGDGRSLLRRRLPSPLRGSGLLWDRLPGADAPGYMPLPLAGQNQMGEEGQDNDRNLYSLFAPSCSLTRAATEGSRLAK